MTTDLQQSIAIPCLDVPDCQLLEHSDPTGAMSSQSITDLYQIFQNQNNMKASVTSPEPLAAIMAKGPLFLLYRPEASDLK